MYTHLTNTTTAVVTLPNPCDVPGIGVLPGCLAAGAAGNAAAVVDFAKDPLGYVAAEMANAAASLVDAIIPTLATLTQPDLSADWFVSAYQISFAAAIMGWIVILLWDFATFKQRGESGAEVVDSVFRWSPVFLIGAMFGPVAGTAILGFVGALNAALARWGILGTYEEVLVEMKELILGAPEQVAGGTVVAIIVLLFMIIALLMTGVVLLVMMVTLYLSGVAFPLSLMWLAKANSRHKGRRILMVWAGILTAQPLIFLMLGAAFSGVAERAFSALSASGLQEPDPATALIHLVTVVIMLMIAGFGPAALANYAPVGPTDADSRGPRASARGGGSTSRPSSPTNSQTAQTATSNASKAAATGGGGAASGAIGGAVVAGGAAAATGGASLAASGAAGATGSGTGIAAKVAAMRSQSGGSGGGASSSSGSSGTGQSSSGSASGTPAPGAAGAGAGQSQNGGQSQGSTSGGSSGGGSSSSGASGLRGLGAAALAGAGKVGAMAQQAGDDAEAGMSHWRQSKGES